MEKAEPVFCRFATMGLAVSASLCFAQENRDASQGTATIFAAIIAAVSAIAAVVGAVVANRNARVALKSAYAVMTTAQKKRVGHWSWSRRSLA